MNALHLVGNPAFGHALDIHSSSIGGVWKDHFVLCFHLTETGK